MIKAVYRLVPSIGRVKRRTIPVNRKIIKGEVRFIAEEGFEVKFQAPHKVKQTFEESTVQIVGAGMYLPPRRFIDSWTPKADPGRITSILVRKGQAVVSIVK